VESVIRRPAATGREAATFLVTGPSLALTEAKCRGVAMFERCPAMHSIILAPCRIGLGDRVIEARRATAIPAGVRHHVRSIDAEVGGVAYFDPRRYAFEDVARLAERWGGFVVGCDDLREAFGDGLRVPRRRVDPRLLRALEALEVEGATIDDAASRARVSASRLAHLVSETLGPSPLSFRTWFKLRRALGSVLLGGSNLTEAAHAAGFADSAHLTRTCKHLMGVRPAQMMPPLIHVSSED